MTKRVTIIDVKDYVGQEVTIGAWVANKSGKGKSLSYNCVMEQPSFKVWLLNQTLSKNLVKKWDLRSLMLSNA